MRWSLNPYDGPWPLASSPRVSDAMAKAVGAKAGAISRRRPPSPKRSAAWRRANYYQLPPAMRLSSGLRGRIPKRHRLSWAVNCEREFNRGAQR